MARLRLIFWLAATLASAGVTLRLAIAWINAEPAGPGVWLMAIFGGGVCILKNLEAVAQALSALLEPRRKPLSDRHAIAD